MTTRDYILIAEALRKMRRSEAYTDEYISPEHVEDHTHYKITKKLCEVFLKENDRFQTRKFMSAVYGAGATDSTR